MKKVIFSLAILLILTSTAWAEEVSTEAGMKFPLWEWSQTARAGDAYLSRTGGMLTDGIYRILYSPFKMLVKAKDVVAASDLHPADPFLWVVGLAQGLYVAGDSIATGVINIAGSLIPDVHGIDHLYLGWSEE